MRTSISTASVEQLAVPVAYLEAGNTLVDITTYPVFITLTPQDANPTTWAAASWVTINNQLCAVTTIGPGTSIGTLTPDVYDCWVKVVASSETPILRSSGKVNIFG